ncbi:unnamed protein product [Taenia asiatica]|uniref:ANF_receptor domain-containing protein n=1 Tax=Taenia asiatica TaxID=60517 RepID=A0A0R3VZ90_TAEAS|nr:unnamed protein product [Taenia asiatica]
MRRRKSAISESFFSIASTKGLSYLRSPTFLLVCLCCGAWVILPSMAQEVVSDCVIHRPSSAKGNYTPPAVIRKVFGQIKQRCDSANRDREIRAANVTNPGYLKSRIPIVKFGVQLATDGRDSIAQMLPAIDLAIEKVTTMPAYRGVVFRVVPILYFDWLACDSLAILEKFNRREVNVIFGPINDFVLGAAARFSTALYLVPIVSPAASSVQLADKNEFGMLTRMYFTYADLEWVVASTLIHFGWEPKISTPIAMITVQPITISDAFNAGWDSFFQQQAISTVLVNYKQRRYHVERGADETRNIFKELPKVARSKLNQTFVYFSFPPFLTQSPLLLIIPHLRNLHTNQSCCSTLDLDYSSAIDKLM